MPPTIIPVATDLSWVSQCSSCSWSITCQNHQISYRSRCSWQVNFNCIEEEVEIKDIPLLPEVIPNILEDVAKKFLPNSVVRYTQDGEFRTVIAFFLSFTGIENHESLDHFATLVLEQMNNFSGYFKEIDFGDKGGVIMGFFGGIG